MGRVCFSAGGREGRNGLRLVVGVFFGSQPNVAGGHDDPGETGSIPLLGWEKVDEVRDLTFFFLSASGEESDDE